MVIKNYLNFFLRRFIYFFILIQRFLFNFRLWICFLLRWFPMVTNQNQSLERKRLKVIQSLFLSFPFMFLHYLFILLSCFWVSLVSLQQKWAMVTKSSENKQFHHQMITFSEEKKNSSPNIIKILKLVTKSIFRHQRCTNWWQNQYFVTKDVQIGDKIFISSL